MEVQIWQAGQPAGVPRPRTCLIATATGDALEQIGKWHEPVPTFGGYEPSHLPFVEPDGDGGSRETAVPARRWVP
uniref:Uncharacterized protein n=1 Tax=Nonomuraea gerenzanensis TaxID=93944 RepID=A0A1M4DZ24_9ACTN|nr:hypothetical protein BN4615_P1323 [Nonomuraea gerenzanensis]